MIVVVVVFAGIGVVGAELFGGPLLPVLVPSALALTILVASTTCACKKLSDSVSIPTVNTDTGGDDMAPEVVKKRTEQWSEEAAVHPAFPPGQGPDSEVRSTTQNDRSSRVPEHTSSRQDSQTSESPTDSSDVNIDDLEFCWQVETRVCFDDLGGMEQLKDQLRAEIIRPLEKPEKAADLGVAAPNVIFHGPPGTGKTYTAQALATELGLPMVELSGADLQSKWINESATKVNDLFREARQLAVREGGALVFVDEIDTVLKNRTAGGNAHEEDNKVVNEFLKQLENTKEHNIVFIGATNRVDSLDRAGLRSGRIDLKIHVGKPDTAGRKAILRKQLADREHNLSEAEVARLAAATNDAVAADIEKIVNQAAKSVLQRDGDVIQPADFR